jgi:hypothetical protein
MGAIIGTLAKRTECAGDYKIYCITAVPASASDTITLTLASHGISEITGFIGWALTGGVDANLLTAQISYSGLVITVVTKGADGLAATNWTNAGISIGIIGKGESAES